MPNAAEGGLSVFIDGGLRIGGGQLSVAGSPLHDDPRSFAISRWLHAYTCHVSAHGRRSWGLTIITFGAVHLLVPCDWKLEQLHATIYCRYMDMVAAPLCGS